WDGTRSTDCRGCTDGGSQAWRKVGAGLQMVGWRLPDVTGDRTKRMQVRAPLFQFHHGDHICVFYRSDDALLEILTPYVAEGLREGQCCFCVQPQRIMQRLKHDLQFLGVKVDREMSRGSLLCYSEREIYFEFGDFDPAGMIRKLEGAIENSLRAGFSGFRSAGELSWAGDSETHCKQVTGYEKMVEECYPGKAAVGLCQYRME